jgi:hypothetical protein
VVVERLAAGRSLREASQELHVSYTTVRNHVQHILPKFGAHSVQEVVARWLLQDRLEEHGDEPPSKIGGSGSTPKYKPVQGKPGQ